MAEAQGGVPEVNLPVSYRDRLATFIDCRSSYITAISYAAAGFSYAAETGYIRCDQCGLTLRGCDAQKYDPLSLHQTFSPHCHHISQQNLSDEPNVSGECSL